MQGWSIPPTRIHFETFLRVFAAGSTTEVGASHVDAGDGKRRDDASGIGPETLLPSNPSI